MILSSTDIMKCLEKGLIEIDPFKEEQLNPNSYDLCLGNWFCEVSWDDDGPVFSGPMNIRDGDRVYIPRGGTLLGATKERIATKDKITGQLHSKSSTRRCGITVCDDAGLGDIGYDNHWTVELSAHINSGDPFLIVGERFAQMTFKLATDWPIKPYQGQYTISDWPECMIPRIYRDKN